MVEKSNGNPSSAARTHVVFQTAFLGDALLSIPLLRRLKTLYPGDSVLFVCRRGFGDFFRRLHIADQVLELDKRNLTGLKEFQERLSQLHICNLISVHQSVRTALSLRSIKAENKISYQQWWNRPFYHQLVKRPMQWPEPLRALALISTIDSHVADQLKNLRANDHQVNLKTKSAVMNWPHPILEEHHMRVEPDLAVSRHVTSQLLSPYIVIAPSSQWPTKRWTEAGYARVIELAAERGLNSYLVGTRDERETCEKIEHAANSDVLRASRMQVRCLAGRFDLVQLHALMSRAEVVIANDSGSMHLAATAGRPVVGIFGPTVLAQGYRPWSNQSVVIQEDLSCRPCGRHGHKKCPLGTHDCMKMITPESVMAGVDHLRNVAGKAHATPSQIY